MYMVSEVCDSPFRYATQYNTCKSSFVTSCFKYDQRLKVYSFCYKRASFYSRNMTVLADIAENSAESRMLYAKIISDVYFETIYIQVNFLTTSYIIRHLASLNSRKLSFSM